MAVRAKELKVARVRFPISKTARPRPLLVLGLHLASGVNVVNGKNAHIVIPALGAFAAKGAYQFQFALPVAALFLQDVAVLVPICSLAFGATETGIGWLSALGARSGMAPSVRMVASLTAKAGIALLDRIGVCLKELLAMFANLGYFRSLSHGRIVPRSSVEYKSMKCDGDPGYFEIARRRIEQAMLQTRMGL
jgi:hypothetical protein